MKVAGRDQMFNSRTSLYAACSLCVFILAGLLAGPSLSAPALSRVRCRPQLTDLNPQDRQRIIAWARGQEFGRWSVSPVEFHCYLGGRRYLLAIGDASQASQGIYELDLSGQGDSGRQLWGGSPGGHRLLQDKSGVPHLLLEFGSLKAGLGSIVYTLAKLSTFNLQRLYAGTYDGLEGGCGRPELGISTAKITSTFTLSDKNRDGYLDIFIDAREQDCRTKTVRRVTKLFVATARGFQEQR